MSDLKNMSITQLRNLKKSLTINIAQRRTSLAKMRVELDTVDAQLATFTPREMTKAEVEAALGYRIKLVILQP